MNMNELSALSKDALVQLHKQVYGFTGDYARLSKQHYIDQLLAADPDAVARAMGAGSGASLDLTQTASATTATAATVTPPPAQAATQLLALIQSLGQASAVNMEQVSALVDARLKTVAADLAAELKRETRRVEVRMMRDAEEFKDMGIQHSLFPMLVKALGAGCNVWLFGGAGSGKTTAAENAAKALNLPFYFNGAIDTEYKLLGFIDAQGRIISTAFRKAYENGGVYLFDECDASLAPATLAFNAALANGYADFPDGMVKRHKDFYCIAAGNTWGYGATSDYIGRNKLDSAFLDRFIRLNWTYDEQLERAVAANDEWVDYVQGCRQRAAEKGLKVVISPRASIHGAKLLAAGFKRSDVIDLTLKNGMTPDQWNNVKG